MSCWFDVDIDLDLECHHNPDMGRAVHITQILASLTYCEFVSAIMHCSK
jgi:hypothetical protein